ncbi:MAG TPA: hypothetical protein VFB22_00960 [Candidatus Baltobacteraceae bacterium]|nr:hypothetical protein [Candidatus Baltobacteraceae bacterium]
MTDQTNAANAADGLPNQGGFPLRRTLVWLSIAGASAALTVLVLRATMTRAHPAGDETTERIQALIDEANRLIKALDEKKST